MKSKAVKILTLVLFFSLISSFVVFKTNSIKANSEEYGNIDSTDFEYEFYYEIDSPRKDSIRWSPAMLSTSKSMIVTEPKLKFNTKDSVHLKVRKRPKAKKR